MLILAFAARSSCRLKKEACDGSSSMAFVIAVSYTHLDVYKRQVSLSGVKYPLSDYTLTSTFPLGVSNEYKEDFAYIHVKDGVLLIVLSRD